MIDTYQKNTVSSDLVEKIRGLLRLSTSDNVNESQLAMVKARELALKYELDLASIDAFDQKKSEEPIVKGGLEIGKRMSICQHYVTNILMDFFNVRVIYSGRRSYGKTISFIGRTRDIELAQYLNNYLNEEFLRLWRKYYAQNENQGVTLDARGGFLYGLAQGLREKLNESQAKVERETFTQIKSEKSEFESNKVKECYALQIVSHKERLEEKVNEFYPHLRSHSGGHTVKNHNSIGAGKAIGKTISVNRPLGNGSRSMVTA